MQREKGDKNITGACMLLLLMNSFINNPRTPALFTTCTTNDVIVPCPPSVRTCSLSVTCYYSLCNAKDSTHIHPSANHTCHLYSRTVKPLPNLAETFLLCTPYSTCNHITPSICHPRRRMCRHLPQTCPMSTMITMTMMAKTSTTPRRCLLVSAHGSNRDIRISWINERQKK